MTGSLRLVQEKGACCKIEFCKKQTRKKLVKTARMAVFTNFFNI